MLAETVKNSVPSTRRSSNTSTSTVTLLRSLDPIANVTLFVRKQKSPALGFAQSVSVAKELREED